MPRATGGKTSIARYEDTWETINRLIRRGGSWSGYERNCFFVQSDAGEFLNVSAVSGLDVIEDGRGLAVWDFDRDGDPDLLLKSRNAPQVRLWRNDLATDNARISVSLRGVRSNVQAIGACVTVLASGRRQVQEVHAGSGFLSQNTTSLLFGLGPARVVDELTVRWPSGGTRVFKDLPVNRAYSLREGSGTPVGRPFATSPGSARSPLAKGGAGDSPESSPRPLSLWLLTPLPLPDISLFDDEGHTVRLSEYHGHPLLLNLWSETCSRCMTELAAWKRDREMAVGSDNGPIAVLAVARGELEDDGRVSEETRNAAALAEKSGVRAAFADAEAGLTLAILLEEAARWPREIGLPASLLIDGEGRIVKVYRGPVAWKRITADVASIPKTAKERQRLALPFAGTYYSTSLRRNFFQLGVNFAEAGVGFARWAFEETLRRRPGEPDALYNLGVVHQGRGDHETAKRLYAETLKRRPDFVDAWVNLGVLEAKDGEYDEAKSAFLEALDLREDHVGARINLGNVELALGRPRSALREYQEALELDPALVELHKRIGAVYRHLGDLTRAAEALEEATKTDPGDAEAWSNLGVIHAESGRFEKALLACRKAVELRPDSASSHNNLGLLYQGTGEEEKAIEHFQRAMALGPRQPAPYLNLARAYLRQGETESARRVLEKLLEVRPGQPEALELLRRLKSRS